MLPILHDALSIESDVLSIINGYCQSDSYYTKCPVKSLTFGYQCNGEFHHVHYVTADGEMRHIRHSNNILYCVALINNIYCRVLCDDSSSALVFDTKLGIRRYDNFIPMRILDIIIINDQMYVELIDRIDIYSIALNFSICLTLSYTTNEELLYGNNKNIFTTKNGTIFIYDLKFNLIKKIYTGYYKIIIYYDGKQLIIHDMFTPKYIITDDFELNQIL